jgi:GTPase SAR1 family protein
VIRAGATFGKKQIKNGEIIGESSVGKSSIVARYATDTFSDGKEATIGGSNTNTKKKTAVNLNKCI